MLIEKIKYWIRGFKPAERKRRKCKRFCVTIYSFLKRLLYWFKGFLPGVQEYRCCRRFCPTCEHYLICKLNDK